MPLALRMGKVNRLGLGLVLWRDAKGSVVCVPDRCCHRGAQLSRGRIVARHFFGHSPRLAEFECHTEANSIRVSGKMYKDNLMGKGLLGKVHVLLANLLVLHLTPRMRLIAAATPIDKHRTWLWGRYFQDLIRFPLIGKGFSWLMYAIDFWLLQKF